MMRLRAGSRAPIAVFLAVALVLAGCGSGGSSTNVPETAPNTTAGAAVAKRAAALARAAESKAPRGASPTLGAIYRQFPPPKPNPEVKRPAGAIKAGERACKGKSPAPLW